MIRVKSDASFKDCRHKIGLGVQIVYEKESYEYTLQVKGKCLPSSVQAEIQACIYALQCVKADFGTNKPVVYMSDAMSVIALIDRIDRGECPEDKRAQYLAGLIQEFDSFHYKWIPRKQNKACDRLSKVARKNR